MHTEYMSTKFTIMLALAAGFIGGLISRYSGPTSVYAQAPTSQQEIRAQKFILVDETGVVRGVFGIEKNEKNDKNGEPAIEILDSNGDVFAPVFRKWSDAYGAAFAYGVLPLRPRKHPTLLPTKP